MLSGTAPLPACSGRTDRHRLNRLGDRQLNRALHVIAVSRMRSHPATPRLRTASPGRRQNRTGNPALHQALPRPPLLPDPQHDLPNIGVPYVKPCRHGGRGGERDRRLRGLASSAR
jgi:hypothetical protein